MLIFDKIIDLQAFLNANNKSIGFVPTMGALHQGHISLIEKSLKDNNITICSIFVNPTQFNKEEDLINYPRNTEQDILLLKEVKCDVLFTPSVEEMYPEKPSKEFDFGVLSQVMEAAHRPGHFNGVAMVIERFFDIIKPNRAYFGEKDFQQLAVVRALVNQLNLDTQIVGCPIIREESGLAMSSRNQRLSQEEKQTAIAISKSLQLIKDNFTTTKFEDLKQSAINSITTNKAFDLEYFEIADGHTLNTIKNWNDSNYCVAFVAANIGKVRLIDNMTIIS